MMNEEKTKVDSLYKVLANANPKDSIYECHYYLKNDFDERPDDNEFLSQWQNRVDKNSNILDHLVLIGFDD